MLKYRLSTIQFTFILSLSFMSMLSAKDADTIDVPTTGSAPFEGPDSGAFTSNLTVTNNADETEEQVFGLRPGFTDGLDASDEVEQPPCLLLMCLMRVLR